MSRDERSLSSQSSGLVCGRVSNRAAAEAETANSSPVQAPRRSFCFMATSVIARSRLAVNLRALLQKLAGLFFHFPFQRLFLNYAPPRCILSYVLGLVGQDSCRAH